MQIVCYEDSLSGAELFFKPENQAEYYQLENLLKVLGDKYACGGSKETMSVPLVAKSGVK